MATTINLTNCSSSSTKITGASIGNGKCYSESNGTYTFSSCYDVAACAGNSGVTSISVSPSSMSSGGSSATFTIYCYGTSSVSYTKSGQWSGSGSASPGNTCYSSATVTLSNPGANTGTTSKTWTISAGGNSATVTQSPQVISYSCPYNFNSRSSNIQSFTISLTANGRTLSKTVYVDPRGTAKGTWEVDIPGSGTSGSITLSCSTYPTTLSIIDFTEICTSSPYTRNVPLSSMGVRGEVCV